MRLLAALSSLVVAALLTVGFWAWLGRPVALPDVPGGRLECLSYTATHAGNSPLDKDYAVPRAVIEADLAALKPVTNCIRTYSAVGPQGDALPAAAAAGMQVLLGIWIGSDDERNEKEIAAALELAARYPRAVRALVVGNEVLLRREMTGQRLARIIAGVKARTRHPVTYADIFEFWRRNPVVADAVDVVTIHVLPYWDDPAPVSIDDVQAHVRGIIERARATFPGKAMQIGEIGWPSAGRTRAVAAPTVVNEARFVREFAVAAHDIGMPYNLIESLDQPWKRAPEGTVGGFWGILDKHRQPKFSLSGPVSEWPDWPRAAAFSIMVAALTLAWAWRSGRPLPVWRWGALSVVAAAAGATLWALFAQIVAISYGIGGWLWGAYLMAAALSGGALTLARCGGAPLPAGDMPGLWQTLRSLRRAGGAGLGDSAIRLGLFRWGILVPVAIAALAMAVDPRHRDFLTPAFWLPAAALIVLARRGAAPAPRIEEGWVGATLLACGVFAVDAVGNREALGWLICCMALGLPLRRQIVAEVRRLGGLWRPAGQQQGGGHHGDH